MKRTLIALAIASIAGLHCGAVYAETEEQQLPPVIITGDKDAPPDAEDGHASSGDLRPQGGGGSAGGAGGAGEAAPKPPPPPPPPQTKTQCVANCAIDRTIRDNKCTSDTDALRRKLAGEAQAAQRAKFGWMLLKNLGIEMDLSEVVLQNIDRQIGDFRSFCSAAAADEQNACLEKCQTLVGMLLGVWGWLREA